MAQLKDEDFGINLKLMKRGFFLNVFNPKDKTFFKWNVYRMSFYVFTVITQCVVLIGTYGYVFDTGYIVSDVEMVMHMNVLFQNYLSLLKLIIFLYKDNEAWEVLFDVSRLNVFKSNRCCHYLKMMNDCREWVIKITNIYFCVVCIIVLQWLLCPLVINFFTANENNKDVFKLNIFNFHFPILTATYNQYYSIFYVLESFIMIFIVYMIIYTDIYVITLSHITIYHYKVLYRAFENIGHDKAKPMVGKNL